MTNADVPTLALKDLISNPTNPFTGNPINSGEKANSQYVSLNHDFSVTGDQGTVFPSAGWYAVSPKGETLFDQSRWTWLPELK